MLYRHHSEMLKSLFDHNLDAVVAVDPQGRFTAVNPAGERLSGYPLAELLGMDVTKILTPESVSPVMAAVSRALQGQSLHLEARFARKDGQLKDVIVSGGPIVVDGQPVGVFGIARDVTEHRRMAEEIRRLNDLQRQQVGLALQQSEARYRALVEQMPGIVYVGTLDGRGRLQYISPQVQSIIGYSPEEAMASSCFWLQRLHPEDRERARVDANTPVGRPFTRQYRVIARDGRVVWIRDDAVILPDPAGDAPLMQGVALDITDQVRAEHALRESEQKYRSIVENTQDVIMLTRCDGIITYMSPATRQVFGYEPQELVGQQPWIIHPDDARRVREVHQRALAGESGTNFEYRVVAKDGQVKWVSHSWSTVPTDGQSLIVSVVRDITERKAAQAQIERHERQLRIMASELVLAEERERRQLAGDLHDDIGQLLALAQIRLGVLDRQAKDSPLAEPVAKLRDVVERASQAARSLTFQLCPPALYDLGFVPAAEWLAEDIQQRYGLRVELIDDGADKPLDERLRIVLFRCLREVLINAAKHAGVDAATVRISRAGDWVRVEAIDAGVGFDPQAVRSGAGRSYGLFSVEERLGYLGGRFAVCSSPGSGTTVTLEAPLHLPSSKEEAEAGS